MYLTWSLHFILIAKQRDIWYISMITIISSLSLNLGVGFSRASLHLKSFLTILDLGGQWGTSAGLLSDAGRGVRGRVGVGSRVTRTSLHSARPALTLTRRIAAWTLRRGAAVLDSVCRASPKIIGKCNLVWESDHDYLFLIQSSWQSWCWGRTSWNDTEAGSTDLSHSLSRAWRAVNLLEGSRASIPSRSSRAEMGIRGLNSSLTRLLYCFLGLSCWNPGRLITWIRRDWNIF